jgi:hypothetical protein
VSQKTAKSLCTSQKIAKRIYHKTNESHGGHSPLSRLDDNHRQHEQQQQAVDDGLHLRQHSLCLSPLPPSIPSPLDFDDSSEPVNSNPESKRMRSDGIRSLDVAVAGCSSLASLHSSSMHPSSQARR